MWEVWVEWWSKRNGCFVVIDGNEPHLYMEVQTSGMEWFMRGEWMWERLTGNENGRLLVMWEREWSGLEWITGLGYGIEHGRCHGRKHNHYKLDETPKETEGGSFFIFSFVVVKWQDLRPIIELCGTMNRKQQGCMGLSLMWVRALLGFIISLVSTVDRDCSNAVIPV